LPIQLSQSLVPDITTTLPESVLDGFWLDKGVVT